MSVLEHLWEPDATLAEFRRVLRPGGVCCDQRAVLARQARARVLGVPARPVSPAEEMDDHKTLLRPPRPVAAAGRGRASGPSDIRCFKPQVRPEHLRRLPRRRRGPQSELQPDLPRRDGEIVAALDTDADRGGRRRPRRVRDARRAAVHPRRRRLRGPRRHAVNDFRKICGFEAYAPDRQRLRADRPHQRRGLGHHLRRVARGLAARRRRRAAGLLRRRRRRREERLGQHRRARSSWPRSAAPRSSASSAATAATRPSRRRLRGRSRRCTPTHITPHTEGLCAVVWHLLVTHPALARAATQWESLDVTRSSSPASPVIVGGAGFIGSHFVDRLLAGDDVERSRVYDNFTSGRRGTSRRCADDPRLTSSRGDVERPRPACRGDGRPRHGHPPRLQPRHRAAVTEPAIDFDQGRC